MDSQDYAVPLYLNQSIVFDLLAIMEDGLARVSSVKATESTKKQAGGEIGASNVFALLGVTLRGGRDSESGRETTQRRVHTPTSLFAKVRARLRTEKMVQDLTGRGVALDAVRPGQFVELEVALRRNPLAETLQAVVETIGAIRLLQAFDRGKKPSPAEKLQEETIQKVGEHAKRLINALTAGGSVDLVGPLVPGPGTALVTVETRYWADHSASDIADGRFRVFGKVVRNTNGTSEEISLLRNTQFAHMPGALDPIIDGIKSANENGLQLPPAMTKVPTPALQVLPIAIFL